MLSRRTFLCSSSAAALTACGPRGQFLQPVPGADVAPVPILAVSNRPTLNTTERDTQLRFAKLTIGVSLDRAPGDIPVSGPQAFTLLDQQGIGSRAALRDALGPPGSDPLVLYVHGFNNTPAEAIHRQAQFAYDAGLRGPQVSYVWPSAETPGGYLYDRDSALQARPALEDFLELLPQIWSGEVVIIAHSLGCLLTMEALTRLRMQGRSPRLDGLVLMHPDISPAVFASQVRDLGPLPDNALLIINRADPALQISALFARADERVGMTDDPQDYQALGFDVLDLTDQTDALNPHLAALTSPTVLDRIRTLANR
ncbi:alpha/beta hydrolase [Thalassorhabdomicrobium marinisediminis]|uniref:Alpha/beta hydrolase n=1 Tax=Thalassorhabdomicrobium marinisediminis TaxID=2170577 RepID=A0A2T7G0P6_9RHOB|nr:alpha/beta hydrolase [Thalassorhabdomicrobium marinisediminis]PVA07996.1 hypothetical protein DC363_00400 [Thalassorhabdomicrobium marinisediminis]